MKKWAERVLGASMIALDTIVAAAVLPGTGIGTVDMTAPGSGKTVTGRAESRKTDIRKTGMMMPAGPERMSRATPGAKGMARRKDPGAEAMTDLPAGGRLRLPLINQRQALL